MGKSHGRRGVEPGQFLQLVGPRRHMGGQETDMEGHDDDPPDRMRRVTRRRPQASVPYATEAMMMESQAGTPVRAMPWRAEKSATATARIQAAKAGQEMAGMVSSSASS